MATLNFERTSEKNGFLKPAIITYIVTDVQGRLMLRVVINGRNAHYEGPLSNDGFDLQKSFWGNAWKYSDDTGRTFVSFSQGWRSKVILADEQTYQVKILRKWWLFRTSDIPGSLQAVFRDQHEVVFVLDNMTKRSWTDYEVLAPMQGTITTDIVDPEKIAAFLLAVQYRIEMEMRAAAA